MKPTTLLISMIYRHLFAWHCCHYDKMILFLSYTASTYILRGFSASLLMAWLGCWGPQACWKLYQHNTIRFSKSVVVCAELGQEHTNTKWLQDLNPQCCVLPFPLTRSICWDVGVLVVACWSHHVEENIPSCDTLSPYMSRVEGILLCGFCFTKMCFCSVFWSIWHRGQGLMQRMEIETAPEAGFTLVWQAVPDLLSL